MDPRIVSVSQALGDSDLFPNPHLEQWERAYHVTTTTDMRRRRMEALYAALTTGGRRGRMDGPNITEIPSGLVSAPVKIIDLRAHAEYMARFIAGMFGVIEDAAGALAPEFGWAVVYAPAT